MKFTKSILMVITVFTSTLVKAQQVLPAYQDTLKQLQKELYSASSDKVKQQVNTRLRSTFERALKQSGSFEFPFDSLKEIGRIYSPDKTFRIINWDVPKADGTYEYFGFIQSVDSKHKTFPVFFLTDKSVDIRNAESAPGDANKWFGMLYYKIIPEKVGRKKYYTLLGKDQNDKLTSKKIIDVLYFAPDGSPRFGADIFKLEKKMPKRVVFEYSAQAVMSLNYNETTKQIVFDHLSPSQPSFEGQFQYYGPDFSFDGLEFKKGKWTYVADVDARNGKSEKDAQYNDPKKKKDHENKTLYEPKK